MCYAYLYEKTGPRGAEKNTDLRPTPTEPITCPHCGGQAYLMRGTLHPKTKGIKD